MSETERYRLLPSDCYWSWMNSSEEKYQIPPVSVWVSWRGYAFPTIKNKHSRVNIQFVALTKCTNEDLDLVPRAPHNDCPRLLRRRWSLMQRKNFTVHHVYVTKNGSSSSSSSSKSSLDFDHDVSKTIGEHILIFAYHDWIIDGTYTESYFQSVFKCVAVWYLEAISWTLTHFLLHSRSFLFLHHSIFSINSMWPIGKCGWIGALHSSLCFK